MCECRNLAMSESRHETQQLIPGERADDRNRVNWLSTLRNIRVEYEKLLIIVLVIICWNVPAPEGLETDAMHVLGTPVNQPYFLVFYYRWS
jgi:hypothetical protein